MSGDFEQAKSRVCQSEGAYVSVRPLASSWEQRKLGELYSLVSEKNDLTFGRESIISVANMYFNANVNVTDEQYLRTYNVMRLGDIAFEGHSNKEFSHGRFVENYIGDGIVSHIFTVLRPRVPFDVNYWRYAINNEKLMRLSLIRSTKASTMMHDLVPSDFLREAIPTPTLAEQKEIGAFLVGLDHLITLHQRKCQYRSLYGYLSWEQRKFSEIVDVCSGRDYKHLNEGPIPVYGTGGYMTSVCEALSHNRDAVGIGRKGTIDKPYLLKAPFWTVDTLFYAIPKPDINLEFALCSFLNVDWKSKDESTGLPSLSKEAINETVLRVPNAVEQNHLGSFFTDIDSLITLHQ